MTAASEPSVPLSEQTDPETHHRGVSGGRLRPAVFGAMDGLVTNVSLIAGVGGGGAHRHTVILSGWAGLVAGAFSMATGEFTSVRSQNELVESEVAIERKALAAHPREERAELAASLIRRGVAPALAGEVAEQISESSDDALHFHAQEELGVDPDQLASPYEAAGLSFVAFAIGAAVPLVPYLFGATVLWLSLAATAIALALSGGIVARLTNRPIALGAGRQIALAVLSAGVTYGVGRAIGAGV
ncbi:MAG: VIT1/CCC1 transporter family protein [Acidimicrobiales bacterium]